jgi:acylglycerol lipase
MHYKEHYLESKDLTKLFFRLWKPSVNPKAIICILHGLGEHSGRYEKLAEYYTSLDFAVCAIDYRGHGKASGKRGHASYKNLYTDVETLLTEAENQVPNTPQIIYGHSFGGNIALNYLIEKQPKVAGIIITSPWMRLTFQLGFWTLLFIKVFKFLLPGLTVNNNLDPDDLSRDKHIVRQYISDPLVHSKISLLLLGSAMEYGKHLIGKGYRINVPLLLMHGTSDKITFCKSSELFVRNTGKYTTYKFWNNGFHELHNDLIKNEVFEFTANWIKSLPQIAQ